jgi:hypothetical protein
MNFISYEEALESGHPICERCREILEMTGGKIAVQGFDSVHEIEPNMWKHSLRDKFHAIVYMGFRHVFLCDSPEFDQISLKRIRPIIREGSETWSLSIDGRLFYVAETDEGMYEILNEDGTIVKDEVIEARIFNHMMSMKK